MGTTERIFAIMKYLCQVRHSTMPELAEKFGVSVRTIKRDIDELGFLIPLETKTGRYDGGVYVIDGYCWDKAYMSKEDIALLEKVKTVMTNNTGTFFDGNDLQRLTRIISTYSAPRAK